MRTTVVNYFKKPSILGLSLLEHFGKWLPDKPYLRLMYRLKFGKKLDLQNPSTFSEKLQWLKLYDRKPEYSKIVDKYLVKEYVAKLIGDSHVIPTYGVWDKPEDIEWEKLPDSFVLKTTNGGGAVGVVICKDKTDFNQKQAVEMLNHSLSTDVYSYYKEWPYKNVSKRVIAEKYILPQSMPDLYDYKFFTFNGEPRVLLFCSERKNGNSKWDFYDMNMQRIPIKAVHHNNSEIDLKKVIDSDSFEQMKEIARTLANNKDFVSVDLYFVEDRIYFGEMTFYSGAGFLQYEPADFDLTLGNMLNLTKK